jgi:GGDEF domain-containing protein
MKDNPEDRGERPEDPAAHVADPENEPWWIPIMPWIEQNISLSREHKFKLFRYLQPFLQMAAHLQGVLKKLRRDLADARRQIDELKLTVSRLIVYGEEKGHEAYRRAFDEGVTNLYRRGFFEETVEEFFRKNKRRVCCVFGCLDLTHFKRTNDTFGHAVGDQALKKVADILRSIYETHPPYKEGEEKRQIAKRGIYDIACRHGGDEFLFLVVAVASPEDATILGRRIVREIASIEIEGVGPLGLFGDLGLVYFQFDPDVVKDRSWYVVTQLEKWSDWLVYKTKKYAKTMEMTGKADDHFVMRVVSLKDILNSHPWEQKDLSPTS